MSRNSFDGQAAVLPLGALLFAGSVSVMAQTAAPATGEKQLAPVKVIDAAEPAEVKAKNTLKPGKASIAKGQQQLKDIPQTVTVMTERLMDDRNLDDFREVLKTTAGVTFQAGETGEEDVRMRGFSLGQAGDIYSDNFRDAPLIERDTFNQERIEVLKGSASMLFGKGSTGGVVNQVSKRPFLLDLNEASVMLGTGDEVRLTADVNKKTGDDSALRVNALIHDANHDGARVNKKGIAPTYRWGIGLKDEFSVGLYHLETHGRPIYNHPWFLTGGNRGEIRTSLDAGKYYGLASDYLKTQSTHATFGHIRRFDDGGELKTQLRHGHYERDLWASVIRFGTTGGVATTLDNLAGNTIVTRTPKGRVAESDLTQLQSDYTNKVQWLGLKHELLLGLDLNVERAKRNQNYTGASTGARPDTTVGTPNDGAVSPVARGDAPMNTFNADGLGLYAQDVMAVTDSVKLLGGLRFDHFKASYRDTTGNAFSMTENLFSPRVGAIFQPNDKQSYYVSYGTSYNTSGDTYQFALGSFAAGGANEKLAKTPPEESRNLEIGGKFDLFNNRALLGIAAFYSEKYNERNNDPDSAATQMLLSGKRHATGMEFNLAGRITPRWEVFYNHTWIPEAQIDESNLALSANGTGAQVKGDRPALTPKHSASLWSTYRLTGDWRIGGGLNYRGAQNPDGARHVIAPGFTTVDAMVEYTYSESLTAKLNIKNLTDETYADTLYRGFYGPGAPRTVQLTLNAKF